MWVLDTDTKGTGAEMVPLDRVLEKPAPRNEPFFVPPKRKPREPKPEEPRAPRRFKIVDIVSQAVLAEQVGARETLDVLNDVRSVVDVHVFVWEPKAERWRLLTLDEQRLLWSRRGEQSVDRRGIGAGAGVPPLGPRPTVERDARARPRP